jgi:hypothetical protein
MADAPTATPTPSPAPQSGENSPEFIAYKLLNHIAVVEGIGNSGFGNYGDRKWDRRQLLDAYAECLQAVRLPRRRIKEEDRVAGREDRSPHPFSSNLASRAKA